MKSFKTIIVGSALLMGAPAHAADVTTAQKVKIFGSDNTTAIGNTGDKLKVDATFSAPPTVTANQGTQGTSTSPWYVNLRNASGTEEGTAASPLRIDPTGTTSQPVTQATSPWVTSRNWTLSSGTDSVSATQGTSPWVTSRNWTLASGTDSATVVQGTAAATAGAWPVKNTDGTNVVAVKAASTAAAAIDPAQVVSLSPNSPLPTGANTVGIVNQGTQGSSASPWFANLRSAGGTELATQTNPAMVSLIDGPRATYSASFTGLVSAGSATDIACITGSGTKTVRITRVEISGTTTSGSGASVNLSLIRRSAANTGGTSAAITMALNDTTDAAVTATGVTYTANPASLGATAGTVRAARLEVPSVGTSGQPLEWEFGIRPGVRNVVLRGTSQLLCLNFGAATITGPSISGSIEFTEE